MSGDLFSRLQAEVEAREKAAGLSMADALALPDGSRKLFNWLVRRGEVGLADAAVFSGQDEATVRATLAGLVEQGFVRELELPEGPRYRARLAPKRGRDIPLNIWQALDDKIGD